MSSTALGAEIALHEGCQTSGSVKVVRLMGTRNNVKWFRKILQRSSKIEVTDKGAGGSYKMNVVKFYKK